MTTLVLTDGEILLRVRKIWLVITKVDDTTCPDRRQNSTKKDLDGYDKGR